MSSSVDRYAVIGNPVSHSLSPRIHQAFAEQCGQTVSYSAIEIAVEKFESDFLELLQQGLKGINVTLPFKERIWSYCDQRSQRAELAAAVNTLSFKENGEIVGDNTDGAGLIRDLTRNLGVLIAHRKILILGAGGAVRGVLEPLLKLEPESLTVVNRTVERAEKLTSDFDRIGEVRSCGYDQLNHQQFDVIINGTAAGLQNTVPPVPQSVLGTNSVCYDMMYNINGRTAFSEWAFQFGASRVFDGLGMLVEQAAESFSIWRGVRPKTDAIIASLRDPDSTI